LLIHFSFTCQTIAAGRLETTLIGKFRMPRPLSFHFLSRQDPLLMNSLSYGGHFEIFSSPPRRQAKEPKPIPRIEDILKAKPDKTPNPYFLFCAKRRTELQSQNPLLPSREVTRMLASEWRMLDAAQRSEFMDQYQGLIGKSKRDSQSNGGKPKRTLMIQLPLVTGEIITVPAYF
jgi:hypothetical protein